MARKAMSSGRVLMLRVVDSTSVKHLEARVGSVDPEDSNLPYSPEFAGVMKPGKQFLAMYGSVGTDFVTNNYGSPTQWRPEMRIGYYAKYAGDHFTLYRVEELADTLRWMMRRVAEATERQGHPSTVDEAVALLAIALDCDAVFIRDANGWRRYSNADVTSYRNAVKVLERDTFKA